MHVDFATFREANLIMSESQVLRNILRLDYEMLLEMAEQKKIISLNLILCSGQNILQYM